MDKGYVEISKGIYWVGSYDKYNSLHCNPYLLVDGEEGVLIDPGSILDFEIVLENVKKIIPLENLQYIILHHQDADVCSNIPLFEKAGVKAKLVSHWRTFSIVKYYGITSERYVVDEKKYELILKSGRKLEFIPTPYLHFPGAIATYDIESKILFSSDLFGAFSESWSLFAEKNYLEAMKSFHEHYMPGNEIIRPVMEKFLRMNISMIAPQHGSIIKENIKTYIKELRELQCGTYLNPIKKEILEYGGYVELCNKILKRYEAIFNKLEVINIFKETEIKINEQSLTIIDFIYKGEELWNNFFELIYSKKGVRWITVVEPTIIKYTKEYDIPIPNIIKSEILKRETDTEKLSDEIIKLRKINERLDKNIKEAQNKLTRCDITNLYNEAVLIQNLESEIKNIIEKNQSKNISLLYIDIDDISKFNYLYGNKAGDEIIRNVAYILNELKRFNHIVFKRNAPGFAYYISETTKEEAIEVAETIRNAVANSDNFIEKVTVSIGVVHFNEIYEYEISNSKLVSNFTNATQLRLNNAKNMGTNIVSSISDINMLNLNKDTNKILIVDSDKINLDVLKTLFENERYEVITSLDGNNAISKIYQEKPSIIISEIMLPKIDGFVIRETLLSDSEKKKIPFMIISHLKNEDSIKRSVELEIDYYFKKPFFTTEIIGTVKRILKRS